MPLLRSLCLLSDGDPKATAYEAGKVCGRGRNWNTTHWDWFAIVGATGRQGNVKRMSRSLGIRKEELVEVSHTKEQQCFWLLFFEGKPLGHSGCCFGG
ncbi:hypothetical protein AA106555_0760 [Neokomagataea thailandica NBRC 106555]|uniref:Uncharacterized protein n=1 Tax=Neokomagataea thailandica NBRC 106555 TaxID=1223520 RepID=A0ABQ0QP35_9PROT|nr:hypothetical protein AA106555_0760 [Neokomagataea thailandica NBRC 106555]